MSRKGRASSTVFRTTFLLLLLIVFNAAPLFAANSDVFTLSPYYRQLSITGFTQPISEKTITSEVSGICTAIFADTGDTISSDGRLANVDPTFIQLDLTANRIAQQKARRQLAQEEKSLIRYTNLRRKESTPEATLDEAVLAVDLQKLSLQNLKNEEARLRENLARHNLAAPAGWQLIERYIEPGEFIQAGKPIARLGDFRQLAVPLAVSYSELQALSANNQLHLFFPDIKMTLQTTLYQISPTFDPATRKIPLKLRIIPPPDLLGKLRGGMRVELQITSIEETGNFIAPSSALISSYDATWLMRKDGTRVQVLPLGTSADKKSAILTGEGLDPGQTFLRTPAEKDLPQSQ